MPRFGRRGGIRLGAAVTLLAAAGALPAAGAGQWHALPVAGGPEAVAAAGGLAPGLPAWRVLYEAARRRHGLWGEDAGLGHARPPAASPGGAVALPLAPQVWRRLLRRAEVPDDALALAILGDRRASLLYRGLAALDDSTLSVLSTDLQALRALYERHAEPFAALCGRFRVAGGRVVLPGGTAAQPLWSDLVGQSEDRPAAFLLALLAPAGGRRALLFDAIADLDAAHQRFALSDGRPLPERRERFRALAAVFDREPAWWRREEGAFRRPEADAGRTLRELRLGPEGALAPPAARAFWELVLSDTDPPPGPELAALVRASPPADAAWLAERLADGAAAERAVKLAQVLLAQRVFGEAAEGALSDVAVAVEGLRDAPALVLALERMGTRDPALYAAAVAAGRRAERASDHRRADRVHRALQGALGVVDRARFAGTLDVPATERLLRSLFGLPASDSRAWGPALARWTEEELLPALAGPVGGAEPGPELVFLCAMAGDLAAGPGAADRPRVSWEGARYEVDPGRAERRRLEQVRARQDRGDLARALATCRAASGPGQESCEGALGAAVTALVYASHLGDPEGPALSGNDPSVRHEFGSAPWALPEEEVGPGVPWHVRGSLLGLERPLARLSLRRLAGDALPEEPPSVDRETAQRLAASAALANPRELDDAGRDALARAIEDGRRRVAALSPGDGAGAEAVVRQSGVEPWRGRAFVWLLRHEPAARDGFFSLVELLRLGGGEHARGDAWGTSDVIAAGLRPRLPPPRDPSGRVPAEVLGSAFADVSLRVAAHLAERQLPAPLAPALVKSLLPDLFDEARPVAGDDLLGLEAWVRGLGRERLDEAVSSLAAGGPLLPVAAREGAR